MASSKSPQRLEDAGPEARPVEPSGELRQRILAAVQPGTRLEGFVARVAHLFDLPEVRAREILRGADDPAAEAWVDAPVPRVRLLHFQGGERVAAADCGLVWLPPGTTFPAHRHQGTEWALMLSGSAEEEETGEAWLPGDLVIREIGNTHAFRVVGDEPLLFAVVLHGGFELAEGSEA